MPLDWSARMTPRGYHAVSVTRTVEAAARWNAPTRQVEGHDTKGKPMTFTECDSMTVSDPDDDSVSLTINVGDPVYIRGRAVNTPVEIAIVNTMFEDARGDKWFYATFFWRPEMLLFSEEEVDFHEDEIFLDMEENEKEFSTAALELVPVYVLQSKPSSAQVAESPDGLKAAKMEGWERAPHTFFYRRYWNSEEGTLGWLEPMPGPAAEAAGGEQMDTGAPPEDQPGTNDTDAAAPVPPKPPPKKPARKGKNEERIASLENMVQELTARLSTFDALVAQVSALEQRLASMGVAYAVEMPAAPVAGGVGDDMMNRS